MFLNEGSKSQILIILIHLSFHYLYFGAELSDQTKETPINTSLNKSKTNKCLMLLSTKKTHTTPQDPIPQWEGSTQLTIPVYREQVTITNPQNPKP